MPDSHPLELLLQARNTYSRREIAEYVGRNAKTVGRWEKGEIQCPSMLGPALRDMLGRKSAEFRHRGELQTVDLFAGIGGIRMGFESYGGRCALASEIDAHARKTYMANFGADHGMAGDITELGAEDIPDYPADAFG